MKGVPPAIRKLTVDSPREYTDARPASQACVVETGLRVPMADGTQLAAMLWRPKRRGKYPALVERVPYPLESRTGAAGEYYATRGYAVIGVSLRGRGGSEGDFSGPGPGTPTGDGHATIEWVARQPWCNGRIGMICGSYSGFTQYQTAVEAPPHLDALLVREGILDAYPFTGGAVTPGLAGLAATMTEQDLEHYAPAKRARAERLLAHARKLGQQTGDPDSPLATPNRDQLRLPFAHSARVVGVADYCNEWLAHPARSAWWNPVLLSRQAHQVSVPVCHLGGWFDGLLTHALAAYTSMRQRAGGMLSRDAPQGAEPPDAYEYDPKDPVPTLQAGSAMGLGADQRPVEDRLTTYTSPRLRHALSLVGPIQLRLHAASSAPDTDWIAKLTWVRPNGASVIISGGILRARYRRSFSRPRPLEPDKPELFEIDMTATATVIPAGHRLRLTLTSSDFPAFDRNLNTGGPIGRERRWQTAINLLFHDRLRPSHLLLPVLEE